MTRRVIRRLSRLNNAAFSPLRFHALKSALSVINVAVLFPLISVYMLFFKSFYLYSIDVFIL